MRRRDWRFRAVAAIAAVTVLSGLAQLFAPELVLRSVGAQVTPTSAHFFGIIGMFMALFGGMLLHSLRSPSGQPLVVLWAGLQKLGAAGAVALVVAAGIFSGLALAVAAFDLLSGALILSYRRSLAEPAPGRPWMEVPVVRVAAAEEQAR